MPRGKFKSISLREEIIDDIKKRVKGTSVAKFVEDAIKEKLKREKDPIIKRFEKVEKMLSEILECLKRIESEIKGKKVVKPLSKEKMEEKTKQTEEHPIFDQKDAVLAFIGEKSATMYSSLAFGKIWVGKRQFAILMRKVKTLTDTLRERLYKKYNCEVSLKMLNDDNYILITPKNVRDEELKDWFEKNIPNILNDLAS